MEELKEGVWKLDRQKYQQYMACCFYHSGMSIAHTSNHANIWAARDGRGRSVRRDLRPSCLGRGNATKRTEIGFAKTPDAKAVPAFENDCAAQSDNHSR